MTTWVDSSSGTGYFGGWVADMGVYAGTWPIMFPPAANPDGYRGGEVDFYVMLPNPTDPADVTIVGDGSYDSYIYATEVFTPATAWSDGYWFTDGVGTLTDAPLPPVLQPGAHLYVIVYNPTGPAPTFTPESLVPVTYGGTNVQEWSVGHWSDLQSASDSAGSGWDAGQFHQPILSVSEAIQGYSNNSAWAASNGLIFHSLPFPTVDLHTLEGTLDSDAATLYAAGTNGTGTGGMLHGFSNKHAYDPGDGEGIKALDSLTGAMQLGQCHQAREVQPGSGLPPFFASGFGTVWVDPPWMDDDWLPSGSKSVSFNSTTGTPLTAGFVATYVGAVPESPPTQTINVFARQTTHPLISDVTGSSPGLIQDTSGMVLVASFDVTFDMAAGTCAAPTTIDLDFSSFTLTDDSSGYYGVELVFEPAAWHGSIAVIDVPELDPAALANNSEVTNSSHYGFDCFLTSADLAWTIHWPAFSYWIAGTIGPSELDHLVGWWG